MLWKQELAETNDVSAGKQSIRSVCMSGSQEKLVTNLCLDMMKHHFRGVCSDPCQPTSLAIYDYYSQARCGASDLDGRFQPHEGVTSLRLYPCFINFVVVSCRRNKFPCTKNSRIAETNSSIIEFTIRKRSHTNYKETQKKKRHI